MANWWHVFQLRRGVKAWNAWRKGRRAIRPDLSHARLSAANLTGIDLNFAILSGADLSGADLSEASLARAILIEADLSGACLSGAYLGEADFRQADLSGADLSEANLLRADLYSANLIGAILSRAYLARADLTRADLGGADLGGAVLSQAILSQADLDGTDFSGATIGLTIFGDLNLQTAKGLETLQHTGPSTIGTNTIIRSEGEIPEIFLRGAGLDDTFISYVLSLAKRPIQYYSCFLSYSSKDQDIVDRLYADLQSRGVRCWYAPHKLKLGDYYRHEIEHSIRIYDKLVLVLSEHSVESEWVEKEVDTALKREESMDLTRQVLFPLRLDDAVLQSRRAWVRSLRYHRHIADFTGWKQHDTYLEQFERLLSHLKAGTFENVEL